MKIFNLDNMRFIMMGFGNTILISFLAIIFSIIFAVVLALMKSYCTGRLRLLKFISMAYIELFRCTPNLLWILFIYFTVKGNNIVVSVLAFTIFTSAVMAEIIRGGLNAIPKGQFEAARSQGFGFFATMGRIILPQTFRIIVPALFSQCTTVVKDTSFLAIINVAEFMYSTKVVIAQATALWQMLALYGFVFILYFLLNFSISLMVRSYQKRVTAA